MIGSRSRHVGPVRLHGVCPLQTLPKGGGATHLILIGSRLRHLGPCVYMVFVRSRPYPARLFGDLGLPAFNGGSNKYDNDGESIVSRWPMLLHGFCTFQTLPIACIWRLWIASVQWGQRSMGEATDMIMIWSRLCHVGPCVYMVFALSGS